MIIFLGSDSVSVCLTGLGQVEAAKKLLEASHDVLQSEFGDEFEAVGEAGYYLTLADLHSALAAEVEQFNGALKHVRFWFVENNVIHRGMRRTPGNMVIFGHG